MQVIAFMKKTEPRKEPRRLRPLTDEDLKAVAGGTRGKPGEYTSSSGGGGKL